MSEPFKLTAVEEPKWNIQLPDGSQKSYDPWELSEKLEKVPKDPDGGSFNFDGMRIAFEFPTAEEAFKRASETPPPFTPTRNMLIAMQASLQEFLSNLGAVKKLRELSQK